MKKLNILFLATSDQNHVHMNHVHSYINFSKHNFHIIDPRYSTKISNFIKFELFDVIVIHYSICILFDYYLSDEWREKICLFRGLKIQFIQDEYRWVNQITSCMIKLGIHVLFTLVRQDVVNQAYCAPGMERIEKITVLPGYCFENLIVQTPPISERQLDIFYRGKYLPYWLGSLSQEKSTIAHNVNRLAPLYNLNVDLSAEEEDRVYGENWKKMIASSKTVLGTESGASIWDFNSDVEIKTKQYLEQNPKATFQEVSAALLSKYEGNLIYNTISSRIFEAICLKTALVLFPGGYSGVIKPNIHYIPLEKDYSNFSDVAKKIKDTIYLQEMVDRTFEEIIEPQQYSQKSFIDLVDKTIDKEYSKFMNKNGNKTLTIKNEFSIMIRKLRNTSFQMLAKLK